MRGDDVWRKERQTFDGNLRGTKGIKDVDVILDGDELPALVDGGSEDARGRNELRLVHEDDVGLEAG